MKIAINTRFLLKGKIEGIGRYTYEITKRLVEQHPDDEFLFLFDRPYDESFIFAKNITPIVLFPPARHPFLWYCWFELAVPQALKKYQADVFFSPDSYLSLEADTPTLITVHDVAFMTHSNMISGLVSHYYRYFTPKFLAKATHISVVSNTVKTDIQKYYAIEASKISVEYNACQSIYQPISDAQKTKVKAKNSNNQDYFFFVGAVHPRKNVHRLIAAFDQFKKITNASLKLLIAGRFAWQTGEVKAAYDNATHKSDIIFLGYVSDDALPELMAAALALTWPSLFEGFGLPLLEAMHCDVPIITSDVSAMPEVVGNAALCINPHDTNDIAKAMTLLYQNLALRQKLIENGKTQRSKFNWNTSAHQIYQHLCNIKKV